MKFTHITNINTSYSMLQAKEANPDHLDLQDQAALLDDLVHPDQLEELDHLDQEETLDLPEHLDHPDLGDRLGLLVIKDKLNLTLTGQIVI
jgi:hypothetical protein